MNHQILNGREISEKIISDLKDKIEKEQINVSLAVIQIGDDPSSEVYIKRKKEVCEKIGIFFKLIQFRKEPIEEIKEKIRELNKDKEVTGILIQLPIPEKFNGNEIINIIDVKKDVDGLTKASRNQLINGNETLTPATPKGILRLLKFTSLSQIFINFSIFLPFINPPIKVGSNIVKLVRQLLCVAISCNFTISL